MAIDSISINPIKSINFVACEYRILSINRYQSIDWFSDIGFDRLNTPAIKEWLSLLSFLSTTLRCVLLLKKSGYIPNPV